MKTAGRVPHPLKWLGGLSMVPHIKKCIIARPDPRLPPRPIHYLTNGWSIAPTSEKVCPLYNTCRVTYTGASSVKTISFPVKTATSPLSMWKAVPAKPAIARSKAKTSYGSCCNTFYPKAFVGSETMAFCMVTPKNCCRSFRWFCRS